MTITKILVDVDTKQDIAKIIDKMCFINERIKLELALDRLYLSPSGRGYHVEISSHRKIPSVEVVLIQTILGSDWKREVFNYKRAKNLANLPPNSNFHKYWNVLFHAKDGKERVELKIKKEE